MTRLVARGRIPYGGGFHVTDPMLGVELFAVTFEQLVAKARAARLANGVPVGLGFEDEVEKWCCQAYPVECVNVDPSLPKRRKLTLDDVVRGTRVMASFVVGGRKVVGEEEAQARTEVCLRCPMNQGFAKPCSGVCKELEGVVMAAVGQRLTKGGERLKACGVCACFLRAAVWLPLETQCVGMGEAMKEEFRRMREVSGCWKQCGSLESGLAEGPAPG